MALKIRRLSHALGAEVSGIDIRKPLDEGVFKEVHNAFLEHCVLLFRGQNLTREQHVAFSALFGDVDTNEGHRNRHPQCPQITSIISRPKPNGEPATGRYTGQEWHTDHSNDPDPCGPTLLHAIELPDIGGDTMFCNMYRAYETLSDGMKAMIKGLHAVHLDGKAKIDNSTPERLAATRQEYAQSAHPLAKVHPDTGRIALYISDQVRMFVGMTAEESKPLIDFFVSHAVRPQNVYRHHWQKDDLLMWDNRCLLHIALADYDRTKVRHMEKTTVKGPPSGYAYVGPL